MYEPWSLKRLAAEGVRISQVWPGKNRFYCWGRCIAGPWKDCYGQSCVLVVMAIILGVYFGALALPLAKKVTIWLPISFALVGGITIGFYLATHCTDPGFIPRRPFFLAGLANGRSIPQASQYLFRRSATHSQSEEGNQGQVQLSDNTLEPAAFHASNLELNRRHPVRSLALGVLQHLQDLQASTSFSLFHLRLLRRSIRSPLYIRWQLCG